jgi:secondary thiamine-phosphate synthase enzyme
VRKNVPSSTLTISSRRDKQVLDITGQVQEYVAKSGVTGGLCNLFVTHTTAALTTGESIEGTDEDLMEVLERIIPGIKFRHEHDPSHAPDHMISSIVGASVTVPISQGKLHLGTWQSILLVECNGPRKRTVVVTILPE